MNEWSDYAVFLGVVIALASAWWRMDAFRDKLDALREQTRTDRHELANRIQEQINSIDGDLKGHAERIVRLERNGHG